MGRVTTLTISASSHDWALCALTMTYFRSISATMTFCALLLLATLLGTLVFRRVLRKRRAGIEALSKFRGCLAYTQTCVDQYLRRAPHWHLAEQIVAQLLALEHWTRDGCYPTGRQRARINLGLLAVREIEQVAMQSCASTGTTSFQASPLKRPLRVRKCPHSAW